MNSNIPWEGIDEPIRDVIRTMNELGYKTMYSCAGYKYQGHLTIRNHTLALGGVIRAMAAVPYVLFKSSLKRARQLFEVISDISGERWKIQLSHFNGYYLYYGKLLSKSSENDRKDSWNELRKALDKIGENQERAKRRTEA